MSECKLIVLLRFSIYYVIIIGPKMYQLNKIVFPKIMAYWEDVAYSSLHYDIPMVERIKALHSNDPKNVAGNFL